MPRFDYGCGLHVEERVEARDLAEVPCSTCGRAARRLITSPPHINGAAIPPMRERRIPLTRFVNALDDMQRDARKAGVEPPDVLEIAQRQAQEIQKQAPELITGT